MEFSMNEDGFHEMLSVLKRLNIQLQLTILMWYNV